MTATTTRKTRARRTPAAAVDPQAQIAAKLADAAAAALAAAEIDATASGRPLAEVLADMGLNADGTIRPPKQRYSGPMLALRTAERHYTMAANGQPCNGDELAAACGQYSPETVVKGLIAALGLGYNPYSHLNPGQQSMNLRNKARGALKNGLVQMADIDACLRAASALKVIGE
jgi:hypothetical protein